HEQLARAIGHLGLDATLAPSLRRPTLAPGACFDLSVGGEVLVGGRKTIGSAQALLGPALLQHGAIARADRSAALARFRLESPATDPDISGAELPAASLMAEAIATTWLEEGGRRAPTELVDRTVAESTGFASHFQDPGWTWRR
ncbi:MAG: hypothetical protein ABUL71_00715, partial [Gemmatimonadota bacterium]